MVGNVLKIKGFCFFMMLVLCASVSPSCLTSTACFWSCSERGAPAPFTAAGYPQGLFHKEVQAGFPGRCVGSKVDAVKDATEVLVPHFTLPMPCVFPLHRQPVAVWLSGKGDPFRNAKWLSKIQLSIPLRGCHTLAFPAREGTCLPACKGPADDKQYDTFPKKLHFCAI